MNLKDRFQDGQPRLLVSVKDAQECQAAIQGGAEIVDIKDPSRGSLGRCDEAEIQKIAETARSLGSGIPLTAALGELREWKATEPPLKLPAEIGFVKVGLSGCAEQRDWPTRWRQLRERFSGRLSWVVVVYADYEAARAPSPGQILEAAGETSSDAVLIDTFHKAGRSLTEIVPLKDLEALANRVHEMGLPLAVAGSLRISDLPRIKSISPEIIAVRSAACVDGNRGGPICPHRVEQIREQIGLCFS